jgi:hypothetical protein
MKDTCKAGNTNSSSTNDTGDVTIGLATPQSLAFWYSTIFHENKHSIDAFHGAKSLLGAAIEGAANLEETEEMPRAFDAIFAEDPKKAALMKLSLADGYVRFAGRTAATLAIQANAGPRPSLELAAEALRQYGVADDQIESGLERAGDGTQYFGYIYGRLAYQKMLEDVAAELVKRGVPAERIDLTPYRLQSLGLWNPGRDAATIDALEQALRA